MICVRSANAGRLRHIHVISPPGYQNRRTGNIHRVQQHVHRCALGFERRVIRRIAAHHALDAPREPEVATAQQQPDQTLLDKPLVQT